MVTEPRNRVRVKAVFRETISSHCEALLSIVNYVFINVISHFSSNFFSSESLKENRSHRRLREVVVMNNRKQYRKQMLHCSR